MLTTTINPFIHHLVTITQSFWWTTRLQIWTLQNSETLILHTHYNHKKMYQCKIAVLWAILSKVAEILIHTFIIFWWDHSKGKAKALWPPLSPPTSKNYNISRTQLTGYSLTPAPATTWSHPSFNSFNVSQHSHFKVLIITDKELLHRHSPTNHLRSPDADLLTPITRNKHRIVRDRASALHTHSKTKTKTHFLKKKKILV